MRYAMAVLGLLGVAGSAMAQDGPSFDCSKAASGVEELVCGDAKLAAIDRRLADVYGAALAAAESLDAGAAEAGGTLKATQRGWIKGRDECWTAESLRECVEEAYLTREADLVATWMLREANAVARWTCGGNPANELHVMYFDTPLPGLRAEYGDGVEPMHLSRSASGALYEGSFGRMFWEKSGEALFVWNEGQEQTCLIEE